MPKKGPIIIVEDDLDDRFNLKQALLEAEVLNELIFFSNGPDALDYLKSTKERPFLIICDINLPKQNGIEFKNDIDSDPYLRGLAIPFIFYTTYVSQNAVNEAYKNLNVQGFFQKNDSFKELKDGIRIIIDYWKICKQSSPLETISQN